MNESIRKIHEAGSESILFAHKVSKLLDESYFEEALHLCEEGVKMFPYYSEGHYLLGKCYHVHDKLEDACREYEIVIFLSPGHIRALKALAFIYLSIERETDAHKALLKCMLFDPSDGDVIELLKEKGLYKRFSEISTDTAPAGTNLSSSKDEVSYDEKTLPANSSDAEDERSSESGNDQFDEVPALDLGPDDLDIAYDTGILQWDFSDEDISHIIITERESDFSNGVDVVPEDSDTRTIAIKVLDNDNSDSKARKDLANILIKAFKSNENIRVVDDGDDDIFLTGTLKSIKVTPLLVQTGENVSDPQISVTVHFRCLETETSRVLFDEDITEFCKIDLRAGLSERNAAIQQLLEMIKDEVLNLIIETD